MRFANPTAVYRLPRASSRSAFTLLELMLVLALVAAIMAMVWPAMQRPLATQRLRRAAEQVRMHMIKTRTRAITSGETFAFSYQREKPLLRIEAITQNEALLESAGPQAGASVQGASGAAMTGAAMTGMGVSIPPVEDELPEGIAFYGGDVVSDGRSEQFAAQERMHGSVDLSWSQPILFYPDGTATAARVALVGDRDRAILIELRSLTGGARISDITSVEALRP